jgi:hypothetical protein
VAVDSWVTADEAGMVLESPNHAHPFSLVFLREAVKPRFQIRITQKNLKTLYDVQ